MLDSLSTLCDGGDAVKLVESMLLFDFVRFDESDSKSSLGAVKEVQVQCVCRAKRRVPRR